MDISKRTAVLLGVLTGLLLIGVTAFATTLPTARTDAPPAVVQDVPVRPVAVDLTPDDPAATESSTTETTPTTTTVRSAPNLPTPGQDPTTTQPTEPWTPPAVGEPSSTVPEPGPPVQAPIMTTPPHTYP